MSTLALSWAWQQPVKDPASKLILLKLADQANDEGESWPSRRTLANHCGVSVETVKRRIAKLTDEGYLSSEERVRDDGGRTSNRYRLLIHPPGLPDPAPGSPADPAPGSAVTRHEPSFELSVEPKDSPPISPAPIRNVDRIPVTNDEVRFAAVILGDFNAQAGTRFTLATWGPKIIMRIREHPELGVAQHREVVAANLAAPWWRGRATPSVIYGSAEQFERSMATVGATAGRGLTPEEMETYGTLWGPGTGYDTLAEAKAAGSHPVVEMSTDFPGLPRGRGDTITYGPSVEGD